MQPFNVFDNFKEDFGQTQIAKLKIIDYFENSRANSLEKICGFEAKRRQSVYIYLEICNNLSSILETIFNNSSQRIFQIYKFFDQFRFNFKLDFKESTDLDCFKYKRTKKLGKTKREINENSNLFNFVRNFKNESLELAKCLEHFQNDSNQFLAKDLFKDSLRLMQEKVQTCLIATRVYRGKVEKLSSELAKDFKSVYSFLLLNNQLAFYSEDNKKDGNDNKKSKRNSLELLIIFIKKTKETFELIQEYANRVWSLFESLKILESARMYAIKTGMSTFIIRINELCGNQSLYFSASKYLLENLDANKISEFEFDVTALLLPNETDFILKKSENKILTYEILSKFLLNIQMDDCQEIINSLVICKFECLLVNENMPSEPATIFATIENTLAIYKFNEIKKEFDFVYSTLTEFTSLHKNEDRGVFTLEYQERGLFWNTKKSLIFFYDFGIYNKLTDYLNVTNRILYNFKSQQLFFPKDDGFVESSEDIRKYLIKGFESSKSITNKSLLLNSQENSYDDTETKDLLSSESEKTNENKSL